MAESAEITVKVMAVLPLDRFDGQAMLTHFDPKYVVALLPEQKPQNVTLPASTVAVPLWQVMFFAVHSPVQIFLETDVVGETYRVRIDADVTPQGRRFHLTRLQSS